MLNLFLQLPRLGAVLLTLSVISTVVQSRSGTNDSIRIVAGSCIYQTATYQPLWQYMHESDPTMVILLGDNVYLDISISEECFDNVELTSSESFEEELNSLFCFNLGVSNEDEEWYEKPTKQYNLLLNHSDFLFYGTNKTYNYDEFSNIANPTSVSLSDDDRNAIFYAIWDDHDYGSNNADKDFEFKNITKQGFTYFWKQLNSANGNYSDINTIIDEIEQSGNRGTYYYHDWFEMIDKDTNNNSSGVNDSYFGLRVIGLDSRWDKDDESMLGDAQKEWLESMLMEASESEVIDFYIFCVGTNMYTTYDIDFISDSAETWPSSDREWFEDLLTNYEIINSSLILSGDIHMSLINQNVDNNSHMHEIVTSSMTHALNTLIAGVVVDAAMDDSYVVTPIIISNNFLILDIYFDKSWTANFINDINQVILTASFDTETNDFSYVVVDEEDVVYKSDLVDGSIMNNVQCNVWLLGLIAVAAEAFSLSLF